MNIRSIFQKVSSKRICTLIVLSLLLTSLTVNVAADQPVETDGLAGVEAASWQTYHLPTVSNISGGWKSYVVVQNLNESLPASVKIEWYKPNGTLHSSNTFSIEPKKAQTQQPPSGFSGSAVVLPNGGASFDVAIIVRQEKDNVISAYNAVSDANGSPGWGEPGTNIYAPVTMWYPWSSTWRTTMHIRNASRNTATFNITYRDSNGNKLACSQIGLTLPSNGAGDYSPSNCSTGFYGTATIFSSQPLAVVVSQIDDTYGVSQYNAFSYGDRELYLPSLVRTWYGWDSSFTVQNLASTSATIRIRYVRDDGTVYIPSQSLTVPARGSVVIVQWDPTYGVPEETWHGAATLTSLNGQTIVAIVNQQLTSESRNHQSYSAYLGGDSTLYAPFVGNFFPYGNYQYVSASDVQNLGPVDADVTRHYTPGDHSTPPTSIPPGGTKCFYLPSEGVPIGFGGSLKVTREPSAPLIAGIHNIARQLNGSPSPGDYAASYNLLERGRCMPGQVDSLDWMTMDADLRASMHMEGTHPWYTVVEENDSHLKVWWIKHERGYPWDIDLYDDNYMYFWGTEQNWDDPTSFKTFIPDYSVPAVPRCATPGYPGSTIQLPHAVVRYFENCQEVGERTDIGPVLFTLWGPYRKSLGGDLSPNMVVYELRYERNCDSNYANCPAREVYTLSKRYGIVQWTEYVRQPDGTYKQTNQSTFNKLRDGTTTRYFPCF